MTCWGCWHCRLWHPVGSSQNIRAEANCCVSCEGYFQLWSSWWHDKLISSHLSIPSLQGSLGHHRRFPPFFPLFSTTLWDLANSRPVHSLMLSSHPFLCLPGLLPPVTVPCKMVLVRPDERETWPHPCSLRLFTMVRRLYHDKLHFWNPPESECSCQSEWQVTLHLNVWQHVQVWGKGCIHYLLTQCLVNLRVLAEKC